MTLYLTVLVIADRTEPMPRMAKRNAGSELNHDNWDEEEETEEAGEFKKASDDQMKVGKVFEIHNSFTADLTPSSRLEWSRRPREGT